MTDLDLAISFATHAHRGQRRADGKLPYITHPLQVMETVAGVDHTETMLIAAVLHDVVEDTNMSLEDITFRFGSEVADLVCELTKPDVAGPRAHRVEQATIKLAKASAEAQTIKLADIIDNVRTIRKDKPEFAAQYVQEKLAQYDVMDKADPAMRMKAAEALVNALV